MRVGDVRRGILGLPLLSTGWTPGQLPLVLEQVLEEVVAPLRRRLCPGHLRTAGDGVSPEAGTVPAFPAQPLILDLSPFRLRADQRRIAGAVGLTETMAASDERDGPLVVQRQA